MTRFTSKSLKLSILNFASINSSRLAVKRRLLNLKVLQVRTSNVKTNLLFHVHSSLFLNTSSFHFRTCMLSWIEYRRIRAVQSIVHRRLFFHRHSPLNYALARMQVYFFGNQWQLSYQDCPGIILM